MKKLIDQVRRHVTAYRELEKANAVPLNTPGRKDKLHALAKEAISG